MTRFAWVSLVALALVVLVGPGPVQAAESKKFEEKNCEWALAPGWQFMDVPAEMASNGYVAQAATGPNNAYVIASLRVVDTDDPNFLTELTAEARDGLRGTLRSTTSAKIGVGSLAGVKGTLIHVVGVDKDDVQRLFRVYGIQRRNKIYQFFLMFLNGAEGNLAATADKCRRGVTLLSGGGEEAADEALLGMEGEGGGGDPSDAEPSGRLTQTFKGHNMGWTIPEGSLFEWRAVNTDEDMEQGLLASLRAEVEHPPKKGKEDDGPTTNSAMVGLFVEPLPEGFEPALVVKHPGNQTNWEKGNFDRLEYARTKVVEKLPVGNHEGAGIQMVGMKDEKVRFLRLYFVSLKGRLYRWEILFEGDRDADDDFKSHLRKLMEGVEFLETTEALRGPLVIPGVAAHNQPRGSQADREKEVSSLGFSALKPKGMAVIKLTPGQIPPNLRLAWEMRSEDKQDYLYFDIQSWTVASIRGQKDPELDLIKTREGQWKEHVESPQTVKKGKDPWFKASFNGGKGLGYEFAGYLGEAPYIERGFVVKYKKHLFWVRFQLGGENAEKIFKKTIKAIQKKLKFNR